MSISQNARATSAQAAGTTWGSAFAPRATTSWTRLHATTWGRSGATTWGRHSIWD